MTLLHEDPNSFYPRDVIKLMGKGLSNAEIITEWQIGEMTFYRWIKESPVFKEAFEKGKVARLAYYSRRAREKFEAGDDAGYKFFNALVAQDVGWKFNEDRKNGNTINIQGNLNLIDNQSASELIEFLRDEIPKLPIDLKCIDITPEKPDESSK